MTGFWVWVMARDAYHIGSSGIVYGLLSFLFFSGLLRRDPKTLAVSLVLLFIYGGNMIYGIFPVNRSISWESHLMGAISGLFCSIIFRSSRSSVEPVPVDEENNLLNQNFDSPTYIIRKKESQSKKEIYHYFVDDEDLI
jgi:hypothetical protein